MAGLILVFTGLLLPAGSQLSAEISGPLQEKMKVFVSILPQAYFAERVGGDRVDVSVMVGPGQSPHTYEPGPKQMYELSQAKLYFRIGVDFEKVWMERIGRINPNMKVVDTRRGIQLLPMKTHHDHEEGYGQQEKGRRPQGHHARKQQDEHQGPNRHGTHGLDDQYHREDRGPYRPHGEGLKDPHIWLSLRLVKIQAETMYEALATEDPAHRAYYLENLKAFDRDLDKLDREIAQSLKKAKSRKFIVFHPAWGYLARDYGLEQTPIEIEGKEPTAKDLIRIIEEAKAEGIGIIFVQKQFSKTSAETVARAIGGKVVHIDPLARDYLKNMKAIADRFAGVLK